MSKVSYMSLNPGIILVIEGQECSPMLEMLIYNEDGTPYVYKEPSDAHMAPIIKRMMDALGTSDVRTAVMAVMMIEEFLVKATEACAGAVHDAMHNPVTAHLDSELLHDGLDAYMDGSTIETVQAVITPENVKDHILITFFPDKAKPN